MRPNTMLSGILITKRSSVVSVSRLTRMLVPNPKKAFQSPGVHQAGFVSVAVVWLMSRRSCSLLSELTFGRRGGGVRSAHGRDHAAHVRHPAEDPPLRLDHA